MNAHPSPVWGRGSRASQSLGRTRRQSDYTHCYDEL
jgi:hypothetical protein